MCFHEIGPKKIELASNMINIPKIIIKYSYSSILNSIWITHYSLLELENVDDFVEKMGKTHIPW